MNDQVVDLSQSIDLEEQDDKNKPAQKPQVTNDVQTTNNPKPVQDPKQPTIVPRNAPSKPTVPPTSGVAKPPVQADPSIVGNPMQQMPVSTGVQDPTVVQPVQGATTDDQQSAVPSIDFNQQQTSPDIAQSVSQPADLSTITEPAKDEEEDENLQKPSPVEPVVEPTQPSTMQAEDLTKLADEALAGTSAVSANVPASAVSEQPDTLTALPSLDSNIDTVSASTPSPLAETAPSVDPVSDLDASPQPAVASEQLTNTSNEPSVVSPLEAVQPETPVSTEASAIPQPEGVSDSQASPVIPTVPETAGPDAELKKQHEPVFVMPERLEMGQVVPVKVKVGLVPHPMAQDHFIQSIELFDGEKSIGKKLFSPGVDLSAEADFQVALSAGMNLRAEVICNTHGKFEGIQAVGQTM